MTSQKEIEELRHDLEQGMREIVSGRNPFQLKADCKTKLTSTNCKTNPYPILNIRIKQNLLDRVKQKAKEQNLTVSDWLRSQIIKGVE